MIQMTFNILVMIIIIHNIINKLTLFPMLINKFLLCILMEFQVVYII